MENLFLSVLIMIFQYGILIGTNEKKVTGAISLIGNNSIVTIHPGKIAVKNNFDHTAQKVKYNQDNQKHFHEICHFHVCTDARYAGDKPG